MPTLKSGSVILPDASMSQSGLMVASLIGGFVVYLMMNQKLAVYWSILIGGGSGAAPAATAAPAPKNYGGGLVQPQGPSSAVPGAAIQTTPGMQGN